jgi:hypothetical protein
MTQCLNFIDIAVITLLDYFRSVVRLASARLRKNAKSFFLGTSMSTKRSEDRSSCVLSPLPTAASAAFHTRPETHQSLSVISVLRPQCPQCYKSVASAGQDFGSFLSALLGVLGASALASEVAISTS